MKKEIWMPVVIAVLVIALLVVPVPEGTMNDGGTRVYSALSYKIVSWNREYDDGVFEDTKVYFGADRMRSVDELFFRESQTLEHMVRATVIEIGDKHVLIEPLESEWERTSADRILIGTNGLADIGAKVGDIVEVTYTGGVMESYPAQIRATEWRLSKTLRSVEYTERWLDKAVAERYTSNIFADIVITEIYSNCFFATPVIPSPYKIKLNGTLSADFCVGDQVICTYENTYYDSEIERVECDFLTVRASEWQPLPGVAYKPVIYLYPEEETDVSVRLTLDGQLTCTYPSYGEGWEVCAKPDGTLVDKSGKEYCYLYWEGTLLTEYDFTEGFCVKGEDTAAFLEEALAALGLTRREANEFIVFWLPMMQNNPYNLISFQGERYTDAARLDIVPAPDTVIRVFMAWKASDLCVELPEQKLSSIPRNGFTVVEWGGTEIK